MTFQESETTELKSVVTDDIKKEILAFANSGGGKLYIGVEDDGIVRGVEDPDEVSLQISNMVRDSIRPDLTMFVHYETVEAEGRQIVVADILQGTGRPYYIAKKGLRPEGVYVRQGRSSAPATDAAIRKMIKDTDGEHFEDLRSMEQELSFGEAQKAFDLRDVSFGTMQRKTLGILNQDNIYTNLGRLLSDQCAHTIKIAAFEGKDQNQFKDRREISGSLFRQMDEAYEYIDFRNRVHSSFEGLLRIDQKDYPDTAIREALLNMIIHRDYAFSASSMIRIYDDRIEFISVGGLMDGVTLADVQMGISVCRNEKLANVFYRLKLIEAYGTGIRKMKDAYAEYEMEPQFEVTDNVFQVILPNVNANEREGIPQKNDNDESGEAVISLLREQKRITRKNVEDLLGISQTSAIRLIKSLEEKGQIAVNGKGKNTSYILPDKRSFQEARKRE